MDAKNEDVVFENSPLYLCLVIDARHSSRGILVRSLKASQYFQEIREAPSVQDALALLKICDVDVCIVGPSLTGKAAVEFVKQGSECTKSKDCAFLTILPEGSVMAQNMVDAGSNAVLVEPYKRFEFREALIHAVVRANANSPWRGILLNQLGSEEALEGVIINILAPKADLEPDPEPPENPFLDLGTEVDNGRNFAGVVAESPEYLESIVNFILRGRMKFDANVEPSRDSLRAVNALVEGMLQKSGASHSMKHFAEFLREALVQWFADLKTFDRTTATDLLKKRILEYSSL